MNIVLYYKYFTKTSSVVQLANVRAAGFNSRQRQTTFVNVFFNKKKIICNEYIITDERFPVTED